GGCLLQLEGRAGTADPHLHGRGRTGGSREHPGQYGLGCDGRNGPPVRSGTQRNRKRSIRQMTIRKLLALVLCAGMMLGAGCARVILDPRGGMETVSVPTLPYMNELQLEYVRRPEDGPMRVRKDAWSFLWGAVPLNHPNIALLREEMLPPGT